MKILHVVQSLDPAWGGIARVLPGLTKTLTQQGLSCTIATLEGGRFGRAPDVTGADVRRFAAETGSRLGRSRAYKAAVSDLVAGCDVVHLHGLWTSQNWSTGLVARRLGKPYVMTPHSMMMPWAWRRSAWKKRPAGWLFEHRNLRRAACLHALAEGEAAHMRRLGFNDRIRVISNGLDMTEFACFPDADELCRRFGIPRDRKWVLFLGRIHPQKGIIQGMQACFDVLADAPDWHLVVAGPDEIGMRAALEAAVRRKGASGRVTFTGLLNRVEVLAALGKANLLLQPSMSEGLSMSILEALASGVPVLISDACNMPEVQRHGAGRVVEPERRAIRAALRELLSLDDASRGAMADQARRMARELYDWASLGPSYRAMYEDVMG